MELLSLRAQYEAHLKDFESKISQSQVCVLSLSALSTSVCHLSLPQNQITLLQRENVLIEEKLRNAQQISQERLQHADDRVASYEKEITASRSVTLRTLSQLA
jgi:hypothetical protein